MNTPEADILTAQLKRPLTSQRALAETTGHSLGLVNRAVRSLMGRGLLDEAMLPTAAARELARSRAPRNAIILAAGLGMRMAPINVVNPKGLLEVKGEPLIERQIRQLQAAGVRHITVVVGFMKERFDYLIDEYGVELVVNTAYVRKNNLASLALVADRIANTYLVPCDIWCAESPFSQHELRSWYLVTDGIAASEVRVNRRGELAYVGEGALGNRMVGIAYVLAKDAEPLRKRIAELAADARYDDAFWEEALRCGDRMGLPARVVPDELVVEVNTYEQLRDLDGGADRLTDADIDEAAHAVGVAPKEVCDIRLIKKGLVNSTFALTAGGARYAMRIPADRKGGASRWMRERDALRAIAGLGLCDEPLMLKAETGHKLTRYLEGTRPCDPQSDADVDSCMATLRRLHGARAVVPYRFDPFDGIEEHEALRGGEASIFRDYPTTKAQVMALRPYAERHACPPCLIHVDPAPDNFLFTGGTAGGTTGGTAGASAGQATPVQPSSASGAPCPPTSPQLIDWEYAGMGDPHVDVALFCIYSLLDRPRIDHVIDCYFAPQGGCDQGTRAKIYCYIAAGGLLWSNWCEYKWHQGVEFGEYSLKQYRYAKDFARLAAELISERKDAR